MFFWTALLHTPCPFYTLLILEIHHKPKSSRGWGIGQVTGSQPWIIYQKISVLWLIEMFHNACNFLFEGCSKFNFLMFKIIWQNGRHKRTLTVGTSYETRKRVTYQKSVILQKQAGRRKRARLITTARFSLFGMMRVIRETAVTGGGTDLLGNYYQPPPALVMWVEDGGKV